MSLPSDERWHFDRSIPLAVVVVLLLQSGAALLWAGALSARVSELEFRSAAALGLAERTARVETQVMAIRESLQRIERRLESGGCPADDREKPS